jgi:hypothetical protein
LSAKKKSERLTINMKAFKKDRGAKLVTAELSETYNKQNHAALLAQLKQLRLRYPDMLRKEYEALMHKIDNGETVEIHEL